VVVCVRACVRTPSPLQVCLLPGFCCLLRMLPIVARCCEPECESWLCGCASAGHPRSFVALSVPMLHVACCTLHAVCCVLRNTNAS
jgi:hypothetical protein